MDPRILIAIVVLVIAVLAFVVLMFASDALFKYAVRSNHQDPSEEVFDQLLIKQGKADAVPLLNEGRKYYNQKAELAEHLFISSFDGLKLHALFFTCDAPKGIIVISHGYRSAARHDFAPILEKYLGLGYHVLAVDHRGHGKSRGEEICFGVKERYDMRDWLVFLHEKHPDLPVFISGISMGATVALLAAALPDVPENLMGISADCGFSHPKKEVCHVLKNKMNIPVFPLYHLADLVCRKKAGFSFEDCDLVREINGIKVPVLFIHGLADDFVPSYHTQWMYDAFNGEKEIILVEGAGHGMAYLEDPVRVYTVLEAFLERCRQEWIMQNQKNG